MNKKIFSVLFCVILFIGTTFSPALYDALNPATSKAFDKSIRAQEAWLETRLQNAYQKPFYIAWNGLVHRMLGQRFVLDADKNNSVVKLNNGYLSFVNEMVPEDQEQKAVKSIVDLDNYAKRKNVKLLYINAPFKISKYDPQLPEGVEDYSNQMADEFLQDLDAAGIDSMDLRQIMYDEGINQYDMFYKTDHHWNAEGGFWAFAKICERLNEQYGFAIDASIYDQNNYSVEIKEEWFLGSQGKRVGHTYAGLDDMTMFTPKFDTDLVFRDENKKEVLKGSFSQALLHPEKLEPKNYYNGLPHYVYYGALYPLATVRNNLVHDKKILLVGDSFSMCVTPFLSLTCQQLISIDTRYKPYTNVYECISQYKPDVVLILFNSAEVEDRAIYKFGAR